MYDDIQQRIGDYEQEIIRQMSAMQRTEFREQAAPKPQNRQKAKTIKQRGQESIREALERMSGVDLTSIDAIGVETVEVVLSEYGPDLSRFPTEKQFVSHVKLAPYTPRSGVKPLKKKRRNTSGTRVSAALRMAALSLSNSATYLWAYYSKIARNIVADVAVLSTPLQI